ncbi:MAG TPA: MgtC/SapB family protein [Verrucomicrobiae bacterium]|jgi:putative Mg2+ transporter-C (MgtC) family protein|nr:MgtC/SapB family protein [Verrucomicrobiae bacterium]
MTHNLDVVIRLAAATILGALIGLERERHGKEAGFRTYTIVCLGSALVMLVSTHIAELYKDTDASRISAQVVSGIGFLGAGAIIRNPAGVKGITTAAGIWIAAGIGLACGLGDFFEATVSTLLVLVILMIFSRVDRWFEQRKASGGSQGG